ncbi:SDR family oxidoreductase [Aliisedimentitalea scapharcae]|uniref:SDR family oxidoreductase n=1 Tax=Aliisedimentitalea scapharcae TaxID=1524259 RepID=A0ABZ2XTB2_9RHOB
MNKTLLCLGFGYSARALAQQLVPQGWRVIGTTRDRLAPVDGVEVLQWPGDEIPLDGVTHILSSIAPTAQGDPILIEMRDQIARAPDLEWVGYLSTTAVYGDRGGDWVDEASDLSPASPRGQWRVDAERAWQAIDGLPLHIFRLAGIYGPGRGPFSKLKSGNLRRIIKSGQVFSRIHVDDIAQVLVASMTQPNPGAIYNVCDDEPVPPQDVIGYAAELQGLPLPPEVAFEDADMTPMARSFYSENKRVRNDRIKDELGVQLIYPDYRTGLEALVAAESI